ncbi:MAG: MOSC domain-containing protein [Candidatus Altiarchaeota archaeon]
MSGRVVAVCVGKNKSEAKNPLKSVRVTKGLGIEGDVHAGTGRRQISLLASEDVGERFIKAGVKPGDFAENILTAGVDLGSLRVGSKLRVGAVELEVSQIGKECHSGCSIREKTGDCIMPSRGVFAVALTSGNIRAGDNIAVT